jgi:hypothetical protein
MLLKMGLYHHRLVFSYLFYFVEIMFSFFQLDLLIPIQAVILQPSGSNVDEPPSQHTSNCEATTPTTGPRSFATAFLPTTTNETTAPTSSSDRALSITATTSHSIYCQRTLSKIYCKIYTNFTCSQFNIGEKNERRAFL